MHIPEPTITLNPPTQTRPPAGQRFELKVQVDLPLAPGVIIRAFATIRDLVWDRDKFWDAKAKYSEGLPMKLLEPAVKIEERRLLADGLGDEVWKGNEAVDHELVSQVD